MTTLLRRRSSRRLRAVLALALMALTCAFWPTIARAAGNAYVANGDGTVSQYAIRGGGLLSPLAPASIATGGAPSSIVVTPDDRSVYVTSQVDRTVSQYNVNQMTGALSPKTPATIAPGPTPPTGIAVTPDGRNAYVAVVGAVSSDANGAIAQYKIDPVTGALSLGTDRSVPTGLVPIQIAVTPNGKSAYVTNEDSGTVSQYNVDQMTGALSPKSPPIVPAATFPYAITVTRDGRSAYVTEEGSQGGDNVLQYNIDPASGALSPKTPASVATGGFPEGIAVTPDGSSAYVTSLTHNTISQYSIDPVSGALSPKVPATVGAGPIPVGIAVTPDSTSAYVTIEYPFGGGNTVAQYNIDPLSGALSPKAPATVAAGAEPFAIAVGQSRVPTNKQQCKHGGWRGFPQFKNQGQCVAYVEHACTQQLPGRARTDGTRRVPGEIRRRGTSAPCAPSVLRTSRRIEHRRFIRSTQHDGRFVLRDRKIIWARDGLRVGRSGY